MIGRDEVDAKAQEFGIHPSNVQRDYVFGWLIGGLYEASRLQDLLVLKGGNALRKSYFPLTRFSDDLDFTTASTLERDYLLGEFNEICRFAEARSGVRFDIARNEIEEKELIGRDKGVHKLRLYFQDFYGNADHITLKVRVDVTENDRIYLPVQTRRLIHPYTDAAECNMEIRCVKLEEALADKLKCLLQRRYSFDLFDLVYAVFINREIEVDRTELVTTFLKKTIFGPSPPAARSFLLGLPFELLRGFWSKVVCPRVTELSFDRAVALFVEGIRALFDPFSYGERMALAYFPADLRNPILKAASEATLLRVTYDGVARLVEPYSLAFKRRQDGAAHEYLYVWDRTGGRTSGPGIKQFFHWKIGRLENTDEKFEPRFEIELAKAGEPPHSGYFSRGSTRVGKTLRIRRTLRLRRSSAYGLGGSVHKVHCTYCGKTFVRKTTSTRLKAHKDRYGNQCYGRAGMRVF